MGTKHLAEKIITYKWVILVIFVASLTIISLIMSYSTNDAKDKVTEISDNGVSSIVDTNNNINNNNINNNNINNNNINNNNINNNNINFGGRCPDCHNSQLSPSGINKDRCDGCHKSYHGTGPSRYWDNPDRTVHEEHAYQSESQKMCLACHSVPSCNRCHNGHESLTKTNEEGAIIQPDCKSCHGGFPEPKGHQLQRSEFGGSRHSWMGRCETCHNKAQLKFKNLGTYNISDANDSSQLCSVCHSSQYKDNNHPGGIIGAKEDNKGKCVNCHDPHTVGLKSSLNLNIPKISVSGTMEDIKNKVMDNLWMIMISILIVSSVLLEILFKPKEGNIALSKTLRVESDEVTTRSVKILFEKELNSAILYDVSVLLKDKKDKKDNNIELVGISSGNNNAVIFIKGVTNNIEEEELIKNIRSIKGVSNAEYSEEYEVQ